MLFRASISLALLGVFNLLPIAHCSPLTSSSELPLNKRISFDGSTSITLALNTDFPDPSFVVHTDGTWYAFATNGNGKRIQVAQSPDFVSWTLLDVEALPTLAGWETDPDHWAPDVFQRDDGKYVMYYSAIVSSNPNRHCIGVAIADSDKPAGPYIPTGTNPFACPLDQGGAIDASGFQDSDNTRYVLYKVDGNSVGHGGDCNNSVEPLAATPIMLQRVAEDGITPVGDAVQLIDRDASDGPLVEAPSLVRAYDGTYLLFYSTHCFSDSKYDVRVATASAVAGPYSKNGVSLLASNDQLYGPGGATVMGDGSMLFHGWCNGNTVRCMYAAQMVVSGASPFVA